MRLAFILLAATACFLAGTGALAVTDVSAQDHESVRTFLRKGQVGESNEDRRLSDVENEERRLSGGDTKGLAKISEKVFKSSKAEKLAQELSKKHVHPFPPPRIKELADGELLVIPRQFGK
uniref:RxLR effector protein n=1 Tax=Phytophthora sojae TaxID=67593 RepID=G1FS63_PHYSO|nr:Avh218 [Phytophthora sojae]